MKWTISNILTVLRMLLVPVFIVLIYLPTSWSNFMAALVFAIAAITDWFDGYLARKYHQVTKFGTFLDPVADKLIIVIALFILVERNPNIFYTIPAMIIISRELLVSSLREWMASLGQQSKVAVSWLGKVKTAAQMVALTFLIWDQNLYMRYSALVLLYIAVILTIWSMIEYLIIAKDQLFDSKD